jgi:hypothetical protein
LGNDGIRSPPRLPFFCELLPEVFHLIGEDLDEVARSRLVG